MRRLWSRLDDWWEKSGFFTMSRGGEAVFQYCMPPPNKPVGCILGHALDNTMRIF
jgi:valyl-tRNA synthetase